MIKDKNPTSSILPRVERPIERHPAASIQHPISNHSLKSLLPVISVFAVFPFVVFLY